MTMAGVVDSVVIHVHSTSIILRCLHICIEENKFYFLFKVEEKE